MLLETYPGYSLVSIFNCYDGLFIMLMPFFLSVEQHEQPVSCKLQSKVKMILLGSLASDFKSILNFDVSLNSSPPLGTQTANQTLVHSLTGDHRVGLCPAGHKTHLF